MREISLYQGYGNPVNALRKCTEWLEQHINEVDDDVRIHTDSISVHEIINDLDGCKAVFKKNPAMYIDAIKYINRLLNLVDNYDNAFFCVLETKKELDKIAFKDCNGYIGKHGDTVEVEQVGNDDNPGNENEWAIAHGYF